MNSNESTPPRDEPLAVQQRYLRRKAMVDNDRYSMLNPASWQILQERQRLMLRMFVSRGARDLERLDLVEVGCGSGGNLLELLRFGFSPSRLTGIELISDRIVKAREVLPLAVRLLGEDAMQVDLPHCSQDIVYQAVVFSSLLDDNFQRQLAEKMWSWVRPGGAILWYDFVYDNPSNPDVRGVPLSRVKKLFPEGRCYSKRLTLAPPIARCACSLHPSMYYVFNCVLFLRTHVLCWIEKT